MTSKHEAALAYAEHGWAVFPIEPSTKRPYKGTQGFRDATTNPEQIARWWGAEPDAWIGLALRPSGLIAIDVDCNNGKDGATTLTRLEARYGPLPRDVVQRSANGGQHVVMLDPSPGPDGWTRTADEGGEIRGKADQLGCGKNVDIKCNGYILLEPSGRYQWQTFGAAPSVPDAWLQALRKSPTEIGSAPDASEGLEDWGDPSDTRPLPNVDRERLRVDLRVLGPRAQGKSTTFAAVLRIFHDYGLSLDDGYPYLVEWNASCGDPRSDVELHRQIRRIASSGRATGGRGHRRSDISKLERVARAAYDTLSVDTDAIVTDIAAPAPPVTSAGAANTEPVEVAPRLPPPCETPPAHEDASFVAQLEIAAQQVLDRTAASQTKAVSELKPMFETVRSLLARQYPPTPWRVQGLLTSSGVHVIGGEPKTTKSWAATEIAIAVSSGTAAFGKYPVETPGYVAYFYAEDVGPSVQTRINALTHGRKMPEGWQDRMVVQPRGRSIDINNDMDLVIIIASVRVLCGDDIDLLILDPLRDIHGGEEDSSDAMKPVMERMRIIGDILGCPVMFVHHTAKTTTDSAKRRPGQRLRGSGAIHGSVDCGLYLWDLRGDGQNQFVNAVTSENKAGRSAGTFELTLDVTDNRHGTAERARWTVSDRAAEPAKNVKADATLADILMALFDTAAPMTDRAIHAKVKGAFGITVAVLSAAARDGFISQAKAGTMVLGWALTEKGRTAIQSGSSVTLVPFQAPQPNAATAAICNVEAR